MTEGLLIASSNRGRYALKDAEAGPYLDLTSGMPCEVWLGRQWVAGSVEYGGGLYVDADLPHKVFRGYFFFADEGGICGLIVGMKVRVP